ncbi:MAG: hypothetical protein IJ489_01105 [Clostridia bacterium]|nr:hypothetical protein [Clostridia bacterium]
MFCIKCGVELADSEKCCPLCGTVVYHPELTQNQTNAPYPPYQKPHSRINYRGVLFLITMFYVILIAELFVCEITIFDDLNWSLYATGGLLLSYIIILLPTWFKKPNPVIFVPCDFAAIAAYLCFISWKTDGHWFVSFALPVVLGCALIITAIIALCRYVRRGYFFIFGGASVLTGLYIVMLEIFLTITFPVIDRFYFWSIYPLIGFVLLGLALIIIGICRPLRDSLAKKFFV